MIYSGAGTQKEWQGLTKPIDRRMDVDLDGDVMDVDLQSFTCSTHTPTISSTVQRLGTDAGGKIGKIKDLGASAAFSPPCMHQIFCWDVTGHMGGGGPIFIGGSQSSYPPVIVEKAPNQS